MSKLAIRFESICRVFGIVKISIIQSDFCRHSTSFQAGKLKENEKNALFRMHANTPKIAQSTDSLRKYCSSHLCYVEVKGVLEILGLRDNH
jgi:hypothetical protein